MLKQRPTPCAIYKRVWMWKMLKYTLILFMEKSIVLICIIVCIAKINVKKVTNQTRICIHLLECWQRPRRHRNGNVYSFVSSVSVNQKTLCFFNKLASVQHFFRLGFKQFIHIRKIAQFMNAIRKKATDDKDGAAHTTTSPPPPPSQALTTKSVCAN